MPTSSDITASPQNEYWFHVADQKEIPIAGTVDHSIDLDAVGAFVGGLPTDRSLFDSYMDRTLIDNIDIVDTLRTLVGVSDKRMYLELSYLFGRTPMPGQRYIGVSGDSVFDLNSHALQFFKNLTRSPDPVRAATSRSLISQYLQGKGLLQSVYALAKLHRDELEQIAESLIVTKEIQQKEAKRRGHGAEFSLATLISGLGCTMIPSDRHIDPMRSKDPNVTADTFEVTPKVKGATWSFDLIVLDSAGNHRIFLQALIHTSDPGQYGVNKSDETVLIKRALNASNLATGRSKELWGLVDGVGFTENKPDTINKMLIEFDTFVQIKTLYKAGLRLHALGIVQLKGIQFDCSFYLPAEADAMLQKYGSRDIQVYDSANTPPAILTAVPAGKAILFI